MRSARREVTFGTRCRAGVSPESKRASSFLPVFESITRRVGLYARFNCLEVERLQTNGEIHRDGVHTVIWKDFILIC